MKDIELIKALEQVNAEYLTLKNEETPEYVLGRQNQEFKKEVFHSISSAGLHSF